MRTNIEIDDDLLREAMEVAGTTTKRATVEFALRQLVAPERRKLFLDLAGKIDFWPEIIEEQDRRRAELDEYRRTHGRRKAEAG